MKKTVIPLLKKLKDSEAEKRPYNTTLPCLIQRDAVKVKAVILRFEVALRRVAS